MLVWSNIAKKEMSLKYFKHKHEVGDTVSVFAEEIGALDKM